MLAVGQPPPLPPKNAEDGCTPTDARPRLFRCDGHIFAAHFHADLGCGPCHHNELVRWHILTSSSLFLPLCRSAACLASPTSFSLFHPSHFSPLVPPINNNTGRPISSVPVFSVHRGQDEAILSQYRSTPCLQPGCHGALVGPLLLVSAHPFFISPFSNHRSHLPHIHFASPKKHSL